MPRTPSRRTALRGLVAGSAVVIGFDPFTRSWAVTDSGLPSAAFPGWTGRCSPTTPPSAPTPTTSDTSCTGVRPPYCVPVPCGTSSRWCGSATSTDFPGPARAGPRHERPGTGRGRPGHRDRPARLHRPGTDGQFTRHGRRGRQMERRRQGGHRPRPHPARLHRLPRTLRRRHPVRRRPGRPEPPAGRPGRQRRGTRSGHRSRGVAPLLADPPRRPLPCRAHYLGQCAVIVGATLRLVPAPETVRHYLLPYGDLQTFLEDQQLLATEGRFAYLEGQVSADTAGAFNQFAIEAVAYGPPGGTPPTTPPCCGACATRRPARRSPTSATTTSSTGSPPPSPP